MVTVEQVRHYSNIIVINYFNKTALLFRIIK